MQLRNTWARKLRATLAYIESLDTPVAKKTIALIRSGKVIVLSFSEFTPADHQEIYEEMHDKQCKHMHASKHVIKNAKEEWNGRVFENRVYIDEDLKTKEKIARVIVHEVNHYLNDSNNHYETPREKFIEELRADISEDLLYHPIRLTPAYLRAKSLDVIDTRGLDLKIDVLTDEVKEKVLRGLRY